jgi:hypothetical protein
MPSPSTSLATLRPDLAASFQQFDIEANLRGMIAGQALPVIEVMVASGKFGKIPISQLLQNRETSRAPGAGYSRGKFTFTDDSFSCDEHGAEEPVDDREAKLYANYFDAELVAAQRALSAVLVNMEKRVADLLFNATTWTGAALTTAIVNEWDDFTNATPIDDVEAAVKKVYDGSGLWPNALIINRKVFRNLRQCTQVINRIASSGAGSATKAADITPALLAQVFDLPKILVAGGSRNSASEGAAATPAQIWSGEYAMVARVAETNDIREPCVGRIFHWGEDGSSIGGTVETYRCEEIRSDVVRCRNDVDEKVMFVEAAHLLSNVTT